MKNTRSRGDGEIPIESLYIPFDKFEVKEIKNAGGKKLTLLEAIINFNKVSNFCVSIKIGEKEPFLICTYKKDPYNKDDSRGEIVAEAMKIEDKERVYIQFKVKDKCEANLENFTGLITYQLT